jgi:hypothetical protein
MTTICESDVKFLTHALTGEGRPDHVARGRSFARSVAWERMRIMRVRFANRTAFAGRRYRSRARFPLVRK